MTTLLGYSPSRPGPILAYANPATDRVLCLDCAERNPEEGEWRPLRSAFRSCACAACHEELAR